MGRIKKAPASTNSQSELHASAAPVGTAGTPQEAPPPVPVVIVSPPEAPSPTPKPLPRTASADTTSSVPDLLQRSHTIPSVGIKAAQAVRHGLRSRRTAMLHPSIPTTDSCPGTSSAKPVEVPIPKVDPEECFKAAFPLLGLDISESDDCDYDSLAAYFVTPADEADKTRAEIARLIHVVENPDEPLTFNAQGEDSFLGLSSKEGYSKLNDTATHVLRATRISMVDNDSISLLNAKIDLQLKDFQENLMAVSPAVDPSAGERAAKAGKKGAERPTVFVSYECSCALVDFITASMARLVTKIASGRWWHSNLLGVLAKEAAKVKYLLLDVEGNGSIAARNGELALDIYLETFGAEENTLEKQGNGGAPNPDAMYREYSKSASTSTLHMHCVEQQKIRTGIEPLFRYITASLAQQDRGSGLPLTAYEVFSVVMDTGYEGFKALLNQDRDYEFSSTSDLDNLNFAHPAFKMVVDAVTQILANQEQEKQSPPLATPAPPPPPPLPASTPPQPPPNQPAQSAAGTTAAPADTSSSTDTGETTPPPPPEPRLQTKVEWFYRHDTQFDAASSQANSSSGALGPSTHHPPIQAVELNTMVEVLSVMVPLLLATPPVVNKFRRFLDMFYLTGNSDDNVRPYPERPYNVFVRLFTSDFEASSLSRPKDVLRLAEAVRDGLFSRESLLEYHAAGGAAATSSSLGSSSRSLKDSSIKTMGKRKSTVMGLLGGGSSEGEKKSSGSSDNRRSSQQRLSELMDLMETWVYVENAVVVKCGLYVTLVMIGAAVLVAGGLAIGLTLHNRLEGVDPFNITVYAWALAAFFVLVCKALLVRTWSWTDFLHGRVLCSSVSELKAVTGINEQLIMAKLLHDERDSILTTRGPYNSVFQRRSDAAGFAIDLPVNTKTLLLSGLTMLKVETPLGHALVCLDARRGTQFSIVTHKGLGKKENDQLVCGDIDRVRRGKGVSGAGGQGAVRLPMKWAKDLEWRKVEGVYNVLDAGFV